MHRVMRSDNHRYISIGTAPQEGQDVYIKEPCNSGSKGDCCGMSRSGRRHSCGNGNTVMEDTFYLENVGQVTLTLSNTHLLWRAVEDDNQKLVLIVTLHCFLLV